MMHQAITGLSLDGVKQTSGLQKGRVWQGWTRIVFSGQAKKAGEFEPPAPFSIVWSPLVPWSNSPSLPLLHRPDHRTPAAERLPPGSSPSTKLYSFSSPLPFYNLINLYRSIVFHHPILWLRRSTMKIPPRIRRPPVTSLAVGISLRMIEPSSVAPMGSPRMAIETKVTGTKRTARLKHEWPISCGMSASRISIT